MAAPATATVPVTRALRHDGEEAVVALEIVEVALLDPLLTRRRSPGPSLRSSRQLVEAPNADVEAG